MVATIPNSVPRARAGTISDRQLDRLRSLAHSASRGEVSESEAEWLLAVAGPLFDELAERRAVDAELAELLSGAIEAPYGEPAQTCGKFTFDAHTRIGEQYP